MGAVEEAAVDTMAASEVAEEVAVEEVAVSADVAAATTVTKMATLLANALRDAAMEVTTTAIRQDNKSTRDSNDQKMKEKKPSMNRLEVFLSNQNFGLSDAVYLQLSLNVSNAL